MVHLWRLLCLVGPSLAIARPLAAVTADNGAVAEKAAVCNACHGEAGVPITKDIPVIWGQRAGYLFLNLRDFQSGARQNAPMAPIVGDSTNPRLAGQSIDYLRKTMTDFHLGSRGNNPWMAALLKTFADADIEALARYLGGL